ncbi:MAG: respiratory nitrate reductase subunit gamma [Alphaproteobacteria bacterium]
MQQFIQGLIFGFYPYIAIAVFLLGSLIRFDHGQYSWRSGSSQLLRRRQLMLGSNLFHVGILLLFMGHLFGMLTPPVVYHAVGISTSAKQMLAIIAGGLFGGMCFVGMTLLVHRRLFDPRIRATSSRGDIFILLLLYVQLILGLATIPFSLQHADGSTMLLLADWAQRIVTFRPGAAAAVSDVAVVYRLHIFLGLTMFLVFPFTRLVHVWSAPIWYLGRKGYQIVRARRSAP